MNCENSLEKLENEFGLSISLEYKNFISSIKSPLEKGFYELKSGNNLFVFNNFLSETNERNTDLYEWYKYSSPNFDYMPFGFGVYGETFELKVKGDELGSVYVKFTDEDDEICNVKVAETFNEFISKLKPGDN